VLGNVGRLRKLPAVCSEVSAGGESFLQCAAGYWQAAKVSCVVQLGIGRQRKIPAVCSGVSASGESFLRCAAGYWQVAKVSCVV